MARCSFIRADSTRCKAEAMTGHSECWNHRGDLAEQRRRNASKGGKAGGRGRPNNELAKIKAEIQRVIDGVLNGELETAVGAVSFQGYNALIRACEVQRRSFDLDNLLSRLEGLEEAAERLRRGA